MLRRTAALTFVLSAAIGAAALAQAPPQKPAVPAAPQPAPAQSAAAGVPTEATLGVPLDKTWTFIASFDAGGGQRFYIFGTNASFVEVVAWCKSALKQKGELVFDEPATHMFDLAKFREETMAFPPSLTVKDYTWRGLKGYAVAKPGGTIVRYPTIIQIVPIPPTAADIRR
jgi:hypothetical protein